MIVPILIDKGRNVIACSVILDLALKRKTTKE